MDERTEHGTEMAKSRKTTKAELELNICCKLKKRKA